MPLTDVMQSLGDAFSGTDREGSFRKGMMERAKIDETQAQTEAAMALARDRRRDAEKKERQAAAEDVIRQREQDLNDPDKAPTADLMISGLGAEYSGVQAGRGHALDVQQRQTVGNPSLGEDTRAAAEDALAPSAAVISRRPPKPGADPLQIVVDPETGKTVYQPSSQAAGAQVGARPSTAGGGTGAAGIRTADSSLIYRQAAGLLGGTYDPTTGRFAGLDKESAAKVQRIASRAAVLFKAGGMDHATAVDQALDEMKAEGGIGPQFGQDTAAPAADAGVDVPTATNPTTGQKVKYVNGQWVPVQ